MRVMSFGCLNRNCLNEFTTQVHNEQFPPCPRCGGLKVKWVPGGFAIKSATTQNIDRTVAELRETYGDKNYRSPARDESMAPKVNPSMGSHAWDYKPNNGMGWGGRIPLDANGRPVAACVPSGVSAPLSVQQNIAGPRSSRLGAASQIEGSYRPKGGLPS